MLRTAVTIACVWVMFGVATARGAGALESLVTRFETPSSQVSTAQVVAAPGDPLSATETTALVRLAEASTVRISARTCDGHQLGSGFVAMGHTLTNRHLASGATEIKVDRPVSPVLIPIDRRASALDLAIGRPVAATTLEFAESNPETGTTVAMAGHAGGGATIVIEGTVQLYDDGAAWGVDGQVMLIDGSSTGGFSGGPVFDRSGRVVAMLQGYSPTVDLSIAIPAESIVEWLSATERSTESDAEVTECAGE